MNKVIFFRALAIGVTSLTGFAHAQFHQKLKGGATNGSPQQAYTGAARSGSTVTNADGTVATMPSQGFQGVQSGGTAPSGSLGKNKFSTIYVGDNAKKQYGASVGEQGDNKVTNWGRAIHHSDGSFTQSLSQDGARMMEQQTMSKNGVLLQKRMITLDEYSRAKEVLIYDGRDQFKYRGVLLYDAQSRFREEQIYAADGTAIRRKIQEYALDGTKLPTRSVDYVDDVPFDLRLVITHDSEDDFSNPEGEKKKKSGWLSKKGKKQDLAPAQQQPGVQPAAVQAPEPERKRGGAFGRFFGSKKNKK